MHDLFIPLGSLIMGIIGWFAANYYGSPLLKVRELRENVHKAIFLYENVEWNSPRSLVAEGRSRLRDLAAQTDAISRTLPYLLSVYLRKIRRYDLESAANELTRLSYKLGGDDDGATVCSRVQAQEALRLRIDPNELERVQCERRLENVVI